jgi:hypothetical protein
MLRRTRTSPPVAPPPPAPATGPRTALDAVVRSVDQLRATDPADTTGVLTATWRGFAVAQAAGALLAHDNPGDALLARQTSPVFRTVTTLLLAAPSLPYNDPTVQFVDGLAPEDCRPETYFRTDPSGDPTVAGAVRRGILALALEMNTLLPRAAEQARDPADAAACRHGTGLSYELTRCWTARRLPT